VKLVHEVLDGRGKWLL